jgi:beta-keto acid cleavage enzyme
VVGVCTSEWWQRGARRWQGGCGGTGRADEILAVLKSAGVTAPVLLHGEEASCWPLVTHAGLLGLATRIGLEDVLAGPRGQPVTGNAELVRLALVEWTVAPSG